MCKHKMKTMEKKRVCAPKGIRIIGPLRAIPWESALVRSQEKRSSLMVFGVDRSVEDPLSTCFSHKNNITWFNPRWSV